jgi:hypothetical protein
VLIRRANLEKLVRRACALWTSEEVPTSDNEIGEAFSSRMTGERTKREVNKLVEQEPTKGPRASEWPSSNADPLPRSHCRRLQEKLINTVKSACRLRFWLSRHAETT